MRNSNSAIQIDGTGDRWYSCGTLRGPSVTTVRSRIFGSPFPREAADNVEFARQRGTEVHEAIRLLCGGEPGATLNWESLDPEVHPRVEAFCEWRERRKWEPIYVERPFFSERYCFGGTPDQVGRFTEDDSERLVVLDFKPVTAILVGFQLAGYALAVKHELGLDYVIQRVALHLGDGVAKEREMRAHGEDRNAFLSALSLFNYGIKHGAWRGVAS
jgi:hypothetical protein